MLLALILWLKLSSIGIKSSQAHVSSYDLHAFGHHDIYRYHRRQMMQGWKAGAKGFGTQDDCFMHHIEDLVCVKAGIMQMAGHQIVEKGDQHLVQGRVP